jgi:hypothetical protein
MVGDRARLSRDRLLVVERQLDHSHSYDGQSVYAWEPPPEVPPMARRGG